MNNPISCPLCGMASTPFADGLYRNCNGCEGIFLSVEKLPDQKTELTTYKAHNNDVTDKRYQKFVSPITKAILQHFDPKHKGLDFGAGTGPVISHMLQNQGYSIVQYDPYFHPYPDLLKDAYDYIACCEVMEHFFSPKSEFALLKSLLKPGAALFCMTHIYEDSIDFTQWYYRTDPTHVFIYRKSTLEWIAKEFGFSGLEIDKRLICFWN